jgi:hypothetical protein
MGLGSVDRAGPFAVDVDEPHARQLEPAHDLLRLLRSGRRGGTRPGYDGLGATAQLIGPLPGVDGGWDDSRRHQPAVSDHMHLPSPIAGAQRADDLRAGCEAPQPLAPGGRCEEARQPVAMVRGLLEALGRGEHLHPGPHRLGDGGGTRKQGRPDGGNRRVVGVG